LNWGAVVDDGVVLNKDGSLMAGYFYRGRDLAAVPPAEVNRICGVVNAAFARLGGEPNGYQIRAFKDQLTRLSVAAIRMAMTANDHTVQINSQFVDVIELWLTKDENNRVRWNPTLHLNHQYFDSLQKHAVPLDERALAALAHSAMSLDIYAWLAQRLHRIPHGKSQFISWAAIKGQFGADFGRMDHFKETFRLALRQVLSCYPKAKIEADHKGLTLRHSPPPVSARVILVGKLGDK